MYTYEDLPENPKECQHCKDSEECRQNDINYDPLSNCDRWGEREVEKND